MQAAKHGIVEIVSAGIAVGRVVSESCAPVALSSLCLVSVVAPTPQHPSPAPNHLALS